MNNLIEDDLLDPPATRPAVRSALNGIPRDILPSRDSATTSKIEREPHTAYRVWFIEKLIINFALPSDLLWHTVRAFRQGDKTQTVIERIAGLWNGKVEKYQKLLRVKDENGGTIPADYQELCHQTPCGRARLFLATIANRKPRRA